MTNGAHFTSSESQALELLPWYVNGTLDGEEHELVRRELLSSLTCRKEFERLRRMQQLMLEDDGESSATERAFERLKSRIDAGAPPRPGGRRNPRQGLIRSPIARAAVLAASVCGLAWWWIHSGGISPQTYTTMSDSPRAAPGVTQVRVVFAPGVPEAARRELLAEYRLTVAAPPTWEGVYTLALAPDADTSAVIATLRADPRVVFATTPAANEDR